MIARQQVDSPPRLLAEHHRELITRPRGISDDAARRHGLYTETNYVALAAILRWRKRYPPKMGPAVVIRYPDLEGNLNGFAMVRPDNPSQRAGKPVKYESPKGEPPRIYLTRGVAEAIETGGELTITEGALKAIAATENGFPTIGLSGVYGFCRKGVADLPPDLEAIRWKGRKVYIAFDSDRETNKNVRDAEARLAAILTRRGAIVRIAVLPPAADGSKQGLDDFLVNVGAAAFRKLLDHAEEPDPEPAVNAKLPAKSIDSMPEARRLLDAHGRDKSRRLTLRHHHESFYQHTGRRYEERSDDDIRAAVVPWCDQSYFGLTTGAIGNVIACLKAECHVPSSMELPHWLGKGESKPNLIAVQNGLLDIDTAVAGDPGALRPHSPEWFSTVCLPYAYDRAETCPKWQAVLRRNLSGDNERIDVFQEFVGYCLTRSTDEQKFLMLLGDGAVGKSSALAGLIGVLGFENISSVPLERFGDRFALFQTLGKLANIAAEIGETDKVAEGFLKALTSGDPFEFERKHRDPVTALPTARLIFSSNNFPRFNDRTGGLWRRLILLPFDEVIPPAERIKGLDKAAYWHAAGELPGMLNWAIEGLRRLREQGGFTESTVVTQAVAEYRHESNPAAAFLKEHYREHVHGQETTDSVFGRYLEWCAATNHRALSNNVFAKEVRRAFPKAEATRVRCDGRITPIWAGIAAGGDFDGDF
ncbi:MAG: phage/plasmid primase, P4 family [Planctomycetota bacterium]|nr:DUF3854 domain-containing protein [Planctomycetaceae bacterium]MDQ3329650.1 phage/plasmid primase, P4 family [Planctomycetota bacterium]